MRTILIASAAAIAAVLALLGARPDEEVASPAASIGPGRAVVSAPAPPVLVAPAALPVELADLLARVLDPATPEEQLRALTNDTYFALVAWIRAHPERLGELEALLATAAPTSAVLRIAVGALAGAGTPEAQACLVRLTAVRPTELAYMRQVVPVLGFAKQPTAALEHAVRALAGGREASDVTRLAELSLGVLAGHVAAADPARAGRIVDEYAAKLAGATAAEEIRRYLLVLGNAGTPAVVALAGRYLDSDDPAIRARAVEALRRVLTDAAERAILGVLEGDPEARVRASAAWSLANRPATATAIAGEAAHLPREGDEQVASTLLANLQAARTAHRGAVLAALGATAAAHPVPAIRDLARELLADPS
jgi:hypothetical protein